MRILHVLLCVAIAMTCGCSKSADQLKQPIALDKVPAEILKIAQDKYPTVKFDAAFLWKRILSKWRLSAQPDLHLRKRRIITLVNMPKVPIERQANFFERSRISCWFSQLHARKNG